MGKCGIRVVSGALEQVAARRLVDERENRVDKIVILVDQIVDHIIGRADVLNFDFAHRWQG